MCLTHVQGTVAPGLGTDGTMNDGDVRQHRMDGGPQGGVWMYGNRSLPLPLHEAGAPRCQQAKENPESQPNPGEAVR